MGIDQAPLFGVRRKLNSESPQIKTKQNKSYLFRDSSQKFYLFRIKILKFHMFHCTNKVGIFDFYHEVHPSLLNFQNQRIKNRLGNNIFDKNHAKETDLFKLALFSNNKGDFEFLSQARL